MDQKRHWNFLNSLPAAIRKKTNVILRVKSERIRLEREDLMIVEKTDDEIMFAINESNHFHKIGNHEYYSTLDGIYLMDRKGAEEMYKTFLKVGDDEYAATILTAFYDKEWKSIIDL